MKFEAGDIVRKCNGKPFTRGCPLATFVEYTPNNVSWMPIIITVREKSGCLTGHDPKEIELFACSQ